MFKKTLALVLCALMTLGMLAACADDTPAPMPTVAPQGNGQSATQSTTGGEASDPTEVTDGEYAQLPTEPDDTGMGNPSTTLGNGISYISTLRLDVVETNRNGVAYGTDDDKYGIISADGKKDTGAIYDAVDSEGDYFKVRTQAIGTPDELDKLNSIGLVDCDGKELIPAQYAVIEKLSDRFYRVIKVTERTEGEEYLVYLSKGAFSLSAGEDDPRYLGAWSVYDLQTGKEVPNAVGTKATGVSTRGDIIAFTADDGNRHYVNTAGQELPENATYHENGTYTDYSDRAVYDSNGNVVFDGETDGYAVSNWDSGYYRAHKYENGTTSYVLLDESGNICSGVFPKTPYLEEGGLVSCDNKLYDLQGNCIFEYGLYAVYYYDGYWLIRDESKNVYLMDESYNLEKICQLDEDGIYSLYSTDFAVTCRANNEYTYYSIPQKQFVKGTTVAPGLAERANGEKKDLINTMTEEVLLTGYRNYRAEVTEEGTYIYAYTGDHVYDVFFFAA